jgi:hypothetical protein
VWVDGGRGWQEAVGARKCRADVPGSQAYSVTMSEPFVLGDINAARWVVHPPQDPYGDGYVYTVATELHEDGMTAATIAKLDGTFADLVTTLSGFVESLASDWQGWDGIRSWRSMERELTLDAGHDGRGYVSLGVTLRASGPDWDDTAWSARTVFVLEAGEEMTRLAADLTHFFSRRRRPRARPSTGKRAAGINVPEPSAKIIGNTS